MKYLYQNINLYNGRTESKRILTSEDSSPKALLSMVYDDQEEITFLLGQGKSYQHGWSFHGEESLIMLTPLPGL